VLSPSAPLPAIFPHVYERGLAALRALGVEPVEYPTTRAASATAAERARDIMAAFTDDSIAAVLATIGGDDQITVVPHLGPVPPKPFFGYSDNSNLCTWLFQQGLVSYYGGSVMVHLGRPGATHPLTMESLRAALFGSGEYELTCPTEYSDEDLEWTDPTNADRHPPTRPARSGRSPGAPSAAAWRCSTGSSRPGGPTRSRLTCCSSRRRRSCRRP
jgi:muramoyltetrapeptide carboxypeptidase LdcA involved in peptidoglycan recycling